MSSRRRSRATGPESETLLGIGVDVVEGERVRQAIVNWGDRFLSRVFRGEERAYCEGQSAPWRHYAGRFAVKEAVAKAFGTGIGDRVGWRDVQVIRDPRSGAPGVRLCGNAARLAARMGVKRIHVSITHSHTLAIAVVVLIGRPTEIAAGAGLLSPASRSCPPSS
ncbi:MAG: holo-ACP synthase [Kiritimatiellae bacterium]|nr:holo-ACP synthase [Kiritimatiellia bacterium]